MKADGGLERVGIQALGVLAIVWIYFLIKYFSGWQSPAALDIVMVIIGIASGIGVFLWLGRHSLKL
jgi:hypothetical protein